MISVENYNEKFTRYPRMLAAAGWIYGVWYCGGFKKAKLHGQYPNGFLERALALFPKAREVLHCPSGTLDGPGITVDRVQDGVRRPMVVADAARLPFRDHSFDLVLADPPYTAKDSRKYGCRPFPLRGAMDEWWRVLSAGAHLGVLHTYIPQFARERWDLRGLIAVVTGFNRATRMFSVFRRRGVVRLPFHCSVCRGLKETRYRWWHFQNGDGMVCGRCFGTLSRGSRGSQRDVNKLLERFLPAGKRGKAREAVLEGLRVPEPSGRP